MSEATELREAVRQRYAAAATLTLAGEAGSCCGPSCCSDDTAAVDPITKDLYADADAAPALRALGGGEVVAHGVPSLSQTGSSSRRARATRARSASSASGG